MLNIFISICQLVFTLIVILSFYTMQKDKRVNKDALRGLSEKEVQKLCQLRSIKLTQPLTEKTRPASFDEIIGQEQGLRALRAAMCGPNPQHIIIYGPPGIGKTAAARLILEEAKKNPTSPFGAQAKFIETDATIMRYDERNIADPLIGSVHDPIYQGAGVYGLAGVPQPKPGAVTKAHGGVLFIDEIGELHPMQMNKLLKVLEDRKVYFESSYYSAGNPNIPPYIHQVFSEGMPADFRLIGATTRRPEEIPPAIRSRCVEIYFKTLSKHEISYIVQNAAVKTNLEIENGVQQLISTYSSSGRDAINILQTAASLTQSEGRKIISICDVQWVIAFGKYAPSPTQKLPNISRIGIATGLAVSGSIGHIIDVEAYVYPGTGQLSLSGMIEEERFEAGARQLYRKATPKISAEIATLLLEKTFGFDRFHQNIVINIPSGMPVDGPSAGLAMFVAIYSAAFHTSVDAKTAFTGELSISGRIKPVGGIIDKVEAAKNAGANRVIIPQDNWQELFKAFSIEVIPIQSLEELCAILFVSQEKDAVSQGILSALSSNI